MKRETRNLKLRLIAGLLLAGSSVQAIEFVQTSTFVRGEDQTQQEELWVTAQTVQMDGEALDDVFAMGNLLELRGTFSGDVWGSGSDQVVAGGIFNDHVRLASRLVQVSGSLNGSLTAAGNTVKIERTAIIGKNLLCFGENIISEGQIRGNARIVAQQVTLGGRIDGDVSIAAQDIVVLPGTILNGNLSYTSPKELVLSPSVLLSGELTRTFKAVPPRQILKPNLPGHFGFAVAALLTGLVFSSVFPRYTLRSVHLLQTTRGTCVLIGFAALFLIPVVAFLLLFTVVGLPLSILLFISYFSLLYLSKIAVGFWIGAAVLRRKELSKRTLFSTLGIGLIALYAASAFVAISMFVNILVAIFGLGALLLALFKKPVLIIQTPTDIKTTTEG